MKTKTEYFNKSELVNFASGIPSELRELNSWVGFFYRENPQKPDKMKKQPVSIRKFVSGIQGAFNDTQSPENQCSFDEAFTALSAGKVDGIGLYLINTDYAVIDIDNGVDWNNGSPMVNFDVNIMLELFDSWAEYSSSGNGIHIFIKGNKSIRENEYRFGEVGGEIYDGKDTRFIAVTGYAVTDVSEINERQEVLASFCAEVWKSKIPQSDRKEPDGGGFKRANVVAIENHKLTDAQIIDFIIKGKDDENETRRKLYQMWMGTYNEDNLSQYDLKFITNLLFWTQKDEAQTFSVFCQSPYVMRICKTNNPVTLDEN
jgi:putative DNA primase/helicase